LDRSHRQGRASLREAGAPAGIERNVVLTLWDWSTPTSYMHDLTPTDKRNPTFNPRGLIYGSPELSSDMSPGSIRSTTRRPDQDGMARSENTDHKDCADLCAVALLGQERCGTATA
jgi:hypothetical protein